MRVPGRLQALRQEQLRERDVVGADPEAEGSRFQAALNDTTRVQGVCQWSFSSCGDGVPLRANEGLRTGRASYSRRVGGQLIALDKHLVRWTS